MLSSVLNSERAIQVNIATMNTFVWMREMLLSNAKLASQLKDIEERMDSQEMNTILLMDKLINIEAKLVKSIKESNDKKRIGFKGCVLNALRSELIRLVHGAWQKLFFSSMLEAMSMPC